MKKIYSLSLLFVLPVLLMAQGITFEKGSFAEALKKAKAEDKLLFIDGYAVWCGPCKVMANTVFQEKEVGDYFNEHLVALKVDVERGEGPMIKRTYGISGLPGYVFIDGDGIVVYRFSASMSTADFMKEVKLAVSYAKDPNSVGRLTERYQKEKDDEAFMRMYLDKLKESKSTNYTDVLEHYLSIQKSFDESSKEMVLLLADHNSEIIYGGIADRIILDNYGSDAWKLYVRKDVREVFQRLTRSITDNTTNYAIEKRDTAILETAFKRAAENGDEVNEAQRKRTYSYFYLQTGMGRQYKALVHKDNEAFINSLDVEKIRNYYLDWLKRKEEGDRRALATRPSAVSKSDQIKYIVRNYGQFVHTDQEKEDVMRWAKVGYDIVPGEPFMMSVYADVLYLFGDAQEGIKIKDEAYEIANENGEKRAVSIKANLDLMKAGKEISL